VERKPILPPTYMFAAIVLMLGLHFLLPIGRVVPMPWALVGLLPLGGGVIGSVWASNAFGRAGTTVKPFEEPARIVEAGLYRLSRHPMYVCMVVLLLGLAVLLGTVSPLLPVVGFAAVMRRFAVIEERAMEGAFGDEYRAYCGRTRRWL